MIQEDSLVDQEKLIAEGEKSSRSFKIKVERIPPPKPESNDVSNQTSEDEPGYIQRREVNQYKRIKELIKKKGKMKAMKMTAEKRFRDRDSITEKDYLIGEHVEMNEDGYQLTIGANLCKVVSPFTINYCIKLSFIIFLTQMLFSSLYLLDYIKFDKFMPLDPHITAIRILFCLLLQAQVQKEIMHGIKVLTFLKRMKGNRDGKKGRVINILIISMQILAPIFANFVNMLTITQIGDLFSMVKHYVAFGFVLNIDNLYVTMFPKDVVENVKQLNDSGLIVISKDHNSNRKVIAGYFTRKNCFSPF